MNMVDSEVGLGSQSTSVGVVTILIGSEKFLKSDQTFVIVAKTYSLVLTGYPHHCGQVVNIMS